MAVTSVNHIRDLTTRLPQPVRFQLRRLAFLGTGVECQMCGSRVRGLRSHGLGFEVLDRRQVVGGMVRDDDRCPVCHACDRTRLMREYLERHTDLGSRPMRVLHVAPDLGLYLWLQTVPMVTYVPCDLDGDRYRHINAMTSADLTDLPFESDLFDVIICSHVLEHVPDDGAAMAELRRVLAPSGAALLLVPLALDGGGTDEDLSVTDPRERERVFGQWDHVRLYGKDDFVARLERAGLEVSLFNPFDTTPDRAAELHLNPLEDLPIATESR